MKYTFLDITNKEIYSKTRVMFVLGQYNIFNNIVIDELRKLAGGEDEIKLDSTLSQEFEVKSDSARISNSLDLQSFLEVVAVPNITGKWFCSVDLASISKKLLEEVKKYMKNPNDNGILVIYSTEYKHFRELLYNKIINNSQYTHSITLSFPRRDILYSLAEQLFKQRDIQIGTKEAELFVMRMSNAYDDYDEIIDRIAINWRGRELDYSSMQDELKGIENFVLDDLIVALLNSNDNTSTSANRKLYRMLHSLIQEFGASNLSNKIKYRIDEFIQFRIAINTGIIPILTRYAVSEAKRKLGEDHRLSKVSDYQFKKMARIASNTTLKDWTYMRLILGSINMRYNEEAHEKALYSLVNRGNLGVHRLNNILGIEDSLNVTVDNINNLKYLNKDEIQLEIDRKNTMLAVEKNMVDIQ